jgi:plastocyanin
MSAFHLTPLVVSIALAVTPAASIAQAPSPPVYAIAVDSFSFAPKPIRLKAGQAVTLNFVNKSGSGHDFTAKTFFARSRIMSGAAPDGEVDLAPHQTVSLTLVPAVGTYKAHCGHFLHKQMGMTDSILVYP